MNVLYNYITLYICLLITYQVIRTKLDSTHPKAQAKDFGHAFGKLQYHILQISVYVWHDVLHEMHYGKQLDT